MGGLMKKIFNIKNEENFKIITLLGKKIYFLRDRVYLKFIDRQNDVLFALFNMGIAKPSELKEYFEEYLLFDYKYLDLTKKDLNINLGDYVQTLATQRVLKQILPQKAYSFTDRDNLSNYSGQSAFCIMQGFFAHGATFLPNNRIYPIWVGTHFAKSSQEDILRFLKFNPDYFSNQEIGCRDTFTKDFLSKIGVKAYLSRCLTLTFPLREKQETQTKVFIVDVPKKYLKYIPKDILKKAVFVNQRYIPINNRLDCYNRDFYLSQTEKLLNKYKKESKLIITTALHCASPCTAMGIPVVLINDEPQNTRFDFLKGILKIYNYADFKGKKVNFNPKAPNIEKLKEYMIKNLEISIKLAQKEDINMEELKAVREKIEGFTVKI